MAYHIQGRLEESLGQRLETNFNYAHPVLKDQVSILVAIDPSLDAPKNDLEQIMRTVVHDVLEMPNMTSVLRPRWLILPRGCQMRRVCWRRSAGCLI